MTFLNKGKVGNVLGGTSIVFAAISVIIFYSLRGPNTNINLHITIYTILSILGIIFAFFSTFTTKYRIIALIGLLANLFILICAFLLQLAMGIGEP